MVLVDLWGWMKMCSFWVVEMVFVISKLPFVNCLS